MIQWWCRCTYNFWHIMLLKLYRIYQVLKILVYTVMILCGAIFCKILANLEKTKLPIYLTHLLKTFFNLFVVFSDLCLDISSIIVERSTLLPAILPGTLSKTPMTKIAYDTYAALLRLFIHYMSRVRHRVDQPPMNHMIDNEGTELYRGCDFTNF